MLIGIRGTNYDLNLFAIIIDFRGLFQVKFLQASFSDGNADLTALRVPYMNESERI
jgi:hypothetical protein